MEINIHLDQDGNYIVNDIPAYLVESYTDFDPMLSLTIRDCDPRRALQEDYVSCKPQVFIYYRDCIYEVPQTACPAAIRIEVHHCGIRVLNRADNSVVFTLFNSRDQEFIEAYIGSFDVVFPLQCNYFNDASNTPVLMYIDAKNGFDAWYYYRKNGGQIYSDYAQSGDGFQNPGRFFIDNRSANINATQFGSLAWDGLTELAFGLNEKDTGGGGYVKR